MFTFRVWFKRLQSVCVITLNENKILSVTCYQKLVTNFKHEKIKKLRFDVCETTRPKNFY